MPDDVIDVLACVPAREAVLAATADHGLVLCTASGAERLRWSIAGLSDVVTSAAADGGLLAIGTRTGEVRLWSGDGPFSRCLPMGDGRVTAIAFSAAAGKVAIGGVNQLRMVDAASGRLLWSADGPPPATAVRFDVDGRSLLCGFADGRVARWAPGGEAEWFAPPVRGQRDGSAALDRDHAVVSRDHRLVVWRLSDGREVLDTGLGWWGDGRCSLIRWPWLVCAIRDRARVWNLETGTVADHAGNVGIGRPVSGPDGRFAFASPRGDGAVPWLEPRSGRWGSVPRTRVEATGPDQWYASCVPMDWSERGLLVADEVGALAFHPADGGPGHGWRLSHVVSYGGAAATPDGGVVFAEPQMSGAVFHGDATGSRVRALYRHAGNVNAVAVSADGHLVASAGGDGSVLATDLRGGRLHRLRPLHDGGGQ